MKQHAPWVVLFAALSGCSSCHRSSPPVEALPAEPPVPAPDKRIADLVLTTPNATWSHVQKGVGGGLGILPSTFGGLACTAAGLDVELGSEVDGAAPAYGVVALDADDSLGWALAVKLVDVRHTLGLLTGADAGARFTVKHDGAIDVVAPTGSMSTVVAGVVRAGGFLLIAHSEDDLRRLGPYAYRTLPTKPAPHEAFVAELPHEATSGPLHERLTQSWSRLKDELAKKDADQRSQHGGRAPDFGDPQAILGAADVTIQNLLAVLGDLDAARLVANADEGAISATLTLKPAAGAGAASTTFGAMKPGDTTPLAELPDDTTACMLLRDDASTRQKDGLSLGSFFKATLGDRLPAEDAKKMQAAVDDWEQGRGDWLTMGLTVGSAAQLNVCSPAADADKAQRALREGVGLLQTPAFREPLKSLLGVEQVSVTSADVPGLGPATIATLARPSRTAVAPDLKLPALPPGSVKPGAPPPSLPSGLGASAVSKVSVGWGLAKGDVHIAVADDVPAALAADLAPPRRLADDPRLATALGKLQSNVTFALMVRPVQGGGPLVFGWGRNEHDGWAHLELADAFARELARRLSGL